MTSWSLNAWLEELRATEGLVKVRPELAPKVLPMLVEKLKLFKPTPSDMVQLYQAFQTSTLPNDWTSKFESTLDSLHSQESTALAAKVVPQQCDNLCNYLTAKDWSKIEAGSLWEGAAILAERLKSLGLRSLKESTKKVATSILCVFELRRTKKLPPYACIYQLQAHLGNSFKACSQTAAPGVPPLASYPCRPEDLGEAFLEKAYQGEKPEPRYLPELADLVKNHVKVRDTAKCLQGTMVSSSKGLSETCQMQPAVPQPAVQTQQGPPAQDTQPGSAEFMSQMMSWMKSSQEAFQKITAAKTTEMESNKEPTLPLHSIALPGGAPSVEKPAAVQTPVQEGNQLAVAEKSLEEFEQEAFNHQKDKKALKNTAKVMKRAAAAKPGPKGMKRPAAAASSQTSQPSSAPAAAPPGAEVKLGCSRCRGALDGCEQCQRPDFTGVRLHGREAWRRWHEAKEREKAKGKGHSKKKQ